jgi:glycosyltransferase involved in cell wall biosynthesis
LTNITLSQGNIEFPQGISSLTGIKNLLIFYDYFYPAYKAGGPVQSLFNLAKSLSGQFNVYVITGAYEINETAGLGNINLYQWNNVDAFQVYYLTKEEQSYSNIAKLIKQCNPDTIYLNGIYSVNFFLKPLLFWKLNLSKRVQLVLSPRGMLHTKALEIKGVKKNVYLRFFKFFRLQKGIVWHATNSDEQKEIQRQFGKNARVEVIPNIPKKTLATTAPIEKTSNSLNLIYLSLITEIKNLHLALQWLSEINLPVNFHIYGPVKNSSYWEECQHTINSMTSANIKYMGEVAPGQVQSVFAKYHALLLPTASENFGHAIYECMSVGRPVIISDNTPWRDLEKQKAGFDISLNDTPKFKEVIKEFYAMDSETYTSWTKGAWNLASNYWKRYDLNALYSKLF